MPSKRKRSVVGESRGEEHEDSLTPASHSKRRKKSVQYDPQEICQELYETIRNYKSEDGRLICEPFIRAPKRRSAADYYDVVTTPIDLLKIQQKLKTDEYEEIDQLTADVELMVTNAKAYYKKTSPEYKDACDLWELYLQTKDELIAEAFGESAQPEKIKVTDLPMEEEGEDEEVPEQEKEEEEPEGETEEVKEEDLSIPVPVTPEADRRDDPEDLETLFAAVMTAREGDRDISQLFQLLPSKQKYVEYYEVIKEPIDLKMIAQKIQDGHYRNTDTLERDILLLVKNAKTFNEPRSQIYKDAELLKKVFQTKKQEFDFRKSGVIKTSERIRTRERTSAPRLSAVCAALQYQSEEESDLASSQDNSSQLEYDEDSGSEMTTVEETNPIWGIFNAVRNYTTPEGATIADAFLKLPNKRFYPDYYEEIKKPMSLFNVRKKLKHRQYKTIEDIASDLHLVFENARRYNADESKIHRRGAGRAEAINQKRENAAILQNFVKEKKREYERIEARKMQARDSYDDEHRSKKGRSSGGDSAEKRRTQNPQKLERDAFRKRLWTLYKCVYDYTDTNNRALRDIFMLLPSKRDYPDYYQVIMEPVDMTMIEQKVKQDKYTNEQAMLADFDLMFNNARHYNEEESLVYQDANTLERILKNRWRNMCQTIAARHSIGKGKSKSKASNPLSQRLLEMYDTLKDHGDSRGRVLSGPFMKLPLKSDYPDYYEVIKKPIDLQRIQQKMLASQYESVEDMVADFVQMFDNACKYNEPDSLIYKDALTLQRVCLEKKAELTDDGSNEIPDIRALIQEMTTSLFISVFNYQDEEGRCFSDSFAELPEREQEDEGEKATEKEKPLTFDQIKTNLDKGRYRRVDKFQEDMFKVFERARRLSRTDSQLYEDAIELQYYFIKKRDEMCKNGEILITPALSYTEKHLQVALDAEKQEKLPLEQKEDEKKSQQDSEEGQDTSAGAGESSEDSLSYKEQTYRIGDFVYVEPRTADLEPHIMCIEKILSDSSDADTPNLRGNYFYRPNETFHLATRKFLEKEVFKSDFYTSIPMNQILGKCYVMSVKEYFKMKPEGVPDKDVYVCESRYTARHKCFKKIKIWQPPKPDLVKLVEREQPLSPVRVASVFADKAEGKDLDDGETSVLDKKRDDIATETANPEEGFSYYEQLNIASGCYKLGDCVYVRSVHDRPFIARIDKMWTDKNGDAFFFGPWFVRPSEIEHAPTRLFFKREVFLSSIEDTNPMQSILGKCSVLHIKDYCSSRLTEVGEVDVYICESKYHEGEKSIKRLGKGLKKFSLSPKVCDDEIFFFKKQITPPKMLISKKLSSEPSPLLMKVSDDSFLDNDDTRDTFPEIIPSSPQVSVEETPEPESKSRKKAKSSVKRQPSGYIVFSGECRKIIQQDHPECTFGDISRIVGIKWRNLTKEEKEKYEEKAKRIAEEQQAKQQEAERAFNESLNRSQSPWSDYGHSMSPGGGSGGRPVTPGNMTTQGYQQTGYYQGQTQGQYQGMPMQQGMPNGMALQPLAPGRPPGMSPVASNQRPFMSPYQPPGMRPIGSYPTMSPAGQTPPRMGPPGQHAAVMGMPHPGMPTSPHPAMSPGPTPSGMSPPHAMPPLSTSQGSMPTHMVPPPPPPRPPSPMFVSVPPRTQRLLHSEAYLRYIEGLNAENKTVSDWEKNLTATPENTPVADESRLPGHWLSQGPGYHGNVTNALWALRDMMLKDTLNITRTLPFEAL